MPTEITQSTRDNGDVVFRVTGDMMAEDAQLLARLARNFGSGDAATVTIDLADLHFIDSDAATVIRQLQDEIGVLIEGVEIFLQSAIDSAERSGT